MSRPPWARELKRVRVREAGDGEQSRPPWARELKHRNALLEIDAIGRAPRGRVN